MAITDEQRKERKNHLGSSDIAALFTDDEDKSLDPFQNATDVYTSKVFDLEPDKETKAMSRGNRYEKPLIAYAEEELGWGIVTDPKKLRFVCKEHPIFACNLDGFIEGIDDISPPVLPQIIEAKTTGLSGEWGEPGTDDVPLRVILQVQHQMLCTGWQKAHIVVLMGKFTLAEEMYVVERNESIINSIIERGEQFWNDHVIPKIPPEETESGNIQIFKRIRRVPNKYAELKPELISRWEEAKQNCLELERVKEAMFAEILKALGDAEGVLLNDGREFVYFKQRTADKIDRKKLKAEFPDIYNQVATENTARVPRIRKIK